MKSPIYVTQPVIPDLDKFIPYLEQIWRNKILTNGGPFHKQLEEKLCEYLNVDYISLFNNGTIALFTALQALDLEDGEVITTPYTFIATANSIIWNKLKPVFVDIDPITTNIDPDAVEAAVSKKTVAILPVHCYGIPCNVEKLQEIATKNNLKLIYDAAHAFGNIYKGKSLLNYGDLSIVSFHATKVFSTFEGGAIISHSLEMKEKIDKLKNFGIVDQENIDAIGLNGKLSEIHAAFGLLQLETIEQTIEQRKKVDSLYRTLLKDIEGIRCITRTMLDKDSYSYFPIEVKAEYPLTRDQLFEKLESNNIFPRKYFYPLITNTKAYKSFSSLFTNADQLSSNILCLPIYPSLNNDEIDRIVQLIK